MKKNHEESKLQIACVKWFDRNIDKTQAFLYSVPNGGYRKPSEARIMKAEGLRAGVSDLVLIVSGGTTVYIEMKDGNKPQLPSQKRFEQIAKSLGFNYYIARNKEQFKAIVNYFLKF
ncbi:MAG TPA: VRR-NUC domain-containing protein [Alphaproteobacteria bacterium]|nr:VRR-NUC domain-containing protein [Alphaproteobacteria bacterium]